MSPPTWREQRPPQGPSGSHAGHRVAAVVAPAVAAGLLLATDHPLAAALVVLVAVTLLVLGRVRPEVTALVERGLAVVGRAVGRVLSLVLLGAIALFVFAPVAVVAWALRRDPLSPAGSHGATGWRPRPSASRPLRSRTYAHDAAARPERGPVTRGLTLAVRVLGVVLAVLVVNFALGWVWDEFAGSHDDIVTSPEEPGTLDSLARSPAAAAPWAEEYWQEFAALDYLFPPFLLSRVDDVTGEHITSSDGERRSYEPSAPAGAALPEVWFFGGGALWGQGQRDLHTIPSEIAVLAERAGTPIRVRNLGQPGYTSWQSALLVEQELAVRPAPDLVVFYDGADDTAVQVQNPSDQPTFYNEPRTASAVEDGAGGPESIGDLWQEYLDTSAVNRLLQNTGLFGATAAGAAEGTIAERVADLHARSVDLASFAADDAGVATMFAWQASTGVPGDGGAYRALPAEDDAVDLRRVLDEDRDVYLDGVLTNERGAAAVAAALWPLVERELP